MFSYYSPATRFALTKYIKGYQLKELADLYDESDKTLRSWIKPHEEYIGKLEGRKYTPLQVERIFERLGVPNGIIIKLEAEGITEL